MACLNGRQVRSAHQPWPGPVKSLRCAALATRHQPWRWETSHAPLRRGKGIEGVGLRASTWHPATACQLLCYIFLGQRTRFRDCNAPARSRSWCLKVAFGWSAGTKRCACNGGFLAFSVCLLYRRDCFMSGDTTQTHSLSLTHTQIHTDAAFVFEVPNAVDCRESSSLCAWRKQNTQHPITSPWLRRICAMHRNSPGPVTRLTPTPFCMPPLKT